MRILLASAAALVLTACAAPAPQYAWVKEGASAHATQSDLSKCNYQIKLQKTPVQEQNELRKLCMQGEGYRLKRVR